MPGGTALSNRFRAAALTFASLLAVLAGLTAGPAAATGPACTTTLWTAGTGGYDTYRVPAVVSVQGALVAFAEARRNSAADNGDVDVVERRSTDGGCTWSTSVVVSADGTDTVGNPVPVVSAGGGLLLMTNRQAGDVTSQQIQDGTVAAADSRRIFVQTSRDAGVTWSGRREITSTVKRSTWRWYATGPGHGITITHGAAAGRMVVSANHSLVGPLHGGNTLISDDSGHTWRIGAVDDHADGAIQADETTAAELPDGRVYFSSRQAYGTDPVRRSYTYSLNSGSTYSAQFRPMPAIVTPSVEGSLLQDPGLPAGVSCHPLYYTGPEDPTTRQHMTLRRSDDAGLHWRTVAELTAADVPAAYSDAAKINRTTLGVAFETGVTSPYERIDWQPVPLSCP